MKTTILCLLLLVGISATAQKEAATAPKATDKIEAYYFHNTRRCATCKAVETVSQEALKTLDIQLKSLNIEEDANKALAQKVGAAGQALILSNGTKSIDLTSKGFMYARSNPDKLKDAIQKAVKELQAQ
ncbi:nitrophenyl compound nitroreductase subunit ArsF family protein [Sunxiuqinia elliptica]